MATNELQSINNPKAIPPMVISFAGMKPVPTPSRFRSDDTLSRTGIKPGPTSCPPSAFHPSVPPAVGTGFMPLESGDGSLIRKIGSKNRPLFSRYLGNNEIVLFPDVYDFDIKPNPTNNPTVSRRSLWTKIDKAIHGRGVPYKIVFKGKYKLKKN